MAKIFIMKTAILFALLFPLFTAAQIDLYNSSLIDSVKSQLYKYTSNYLVVKAPVSVTQLQIKAVKSRIISNRGTKFEVEPFEDGLDTIRIYSSGKLVYSKIFNVDTLPNPVARVANSFDTVLSVTQILANPFLSLMYPGANFKSDGFISSFSIAISTTADEPYTEHFKTNRISQKCLDLIKTLRPGATIYFDDIRGGGPNSRIHKFPPFTVILK